MKKRMKALNPNCPVAGCSVREPHTNDRLVDALVQRFNGPDRCLQWVLGAMAELRDSMVADLEAGRLFGWYTRMRQIEELYFKTLHILFLAASDEVPHILSGELPNSFSATYNKVNEAIMGGRGDLTKIQPGLVGGKFRMIDNLNDGAHVGFGAMQMVVNLSQNPEYLEFLPAYVKHIEDYCARIDYMRRMFEAGRDKQVVMDAIINMHRPKEYWEQRAKEDAARATTDSSRADQ